MREGYGTCVYFVCLFYNLLLESLFALQTSHIFSLHEDQGFSSENALFRAISCYTVCDCTVIFESGIIGMHKTEACA